MTSPPPLLPFTKPDAATPTGTTFAERRATAPVAKVTMPSGSEAWLVTRYDDVRAVLADPRFSRNLLYPGAPCIFEPGDFSTGERSILNLDPPDHSRLRRLASKAFTIRRLEGMRPRIEQLTGALLDDLASQQPPAELIESFAFPLPGAVICDVLGVPEDERGDFRAWSDVLVAPGQHDRETMAAALGRGFADMRRLVALKREHPGDDLLSALIQARDDDDRLDEEELVQLGTQLLFGGHETAVNLIGTSVVLLMRHPDQLAALRADPTLLVPAIEEVMRYESPTEATLLRVATTDIEVGDVTVRKGEAVMAMICSANFDERQFAEPERFDITRQRNAHVGFGHGIHHCIGAPLARIEGQVALRGLLDRFPGLRLAVPQEEIAWRPEGSTRGPIAVPIAW